MDLNNENLSEDAIKLQERLRNDSPFAGYNAWVANIHADVQAGISDTDLLVKYPDLRPGEVQAMRDAANIKAASINNVKGKN